MTNDHKTDLPKRRTLQLLGGTGVAAALAGSAFPVFAGSLDSGDGKATTESANAKPFQGELHLTLISSPDVVENTLLLRNPTANPVTIDRFLQGSVVFGDQVFDCGRICTDAPLQLNPFAQRAFQVPVHRVASHAVHRYLRADDATWGLAHGTQVVSLSAHLSGSSAVLSLRPVGGHQLMT